MNKIFKHTLNIGGRLIDISSPTVMGIVNITNDSFYEASRACDRRESIVSMVDEHLSAGATFIDIGGCSTRPGAELVSVDEECRRILFALESISNHFGQHNVNISIDTFRSEVVKEVLKSWGRGFIVNDIKAGEEDSNMLKTVALNGLPYIAMHSKGDPKSMDSMAHYDDVVDSVMRFFIDKIEQFRIYGINDFVFDVGFGFAKSIEHNFELVKRFSEFSVLDVPQLVGISRKRMVWQPLGTDPQSALNGTSVINTILVDRGASILRVHDSRQAVEVIKLIQFINKK